LAGEIATALNGVGAAPALLDATDSVRASIATALSVGGAGRGRGSAHSAAGLACADEPGADAAAALLIEVAVGAIR
jgi:hypothetical protein